MRYREENLETLKTKKSRYFKETYDPKKAAIERKARMAYHVEYCQSPDYKAWKAEYDKGYRAKKEYGEFWECFLLSLEIRNETLERMSDYEIRLGKGTLGRTQKSKRDHARTQRSKLEIGPLGDIKRGQRR